MLGDVLILIFVPNDATLISDQVHVRGNTVITNEIPCFFKVKSPNLTEIRKKNRENSKNLTNAKLIEVYF